MKTTKISLIIAAFVFLITGVQSVFAIVQDSSSDTNQDSTISTSPSTNVAQDTSGTVNPNPSSDTNQDGPSGITSSPSPDLNQDTPVLSGSPVTPIRTGGGTSGFSGGNSGLIPATTSCPLITTFMTLGGNNNGAEVSKLQAFLKISVTGVYDAATEAAVRAFQTQYLADTMGPWGAAVPSGRVYITTLKKINQLSCSSPITFSDAELAIINAYKNRGTTGTTTPVIGSNAGNNANASSSVSTSTSPEIGSNGTGNANTAAAANTSVFGRFWGFIKNLF